MLKYRKQFYGIIKLISLILLMLELSKGTRNLSGTLLTNSSGYFEMSDGTRYDSCEEYKTALGDNALNGLYEQQSYNFQIYCLMDGSEFGLNKEYELIFKRESGSINFQMTWSQSLVRYGDATNWWTGFNHIRQKCGSIDSCELVLIMITRNNHQGKIYADNWYIQDEANLFKQQISTNQSICPQNVNTPTSFLYHLNRPFTTSNRDNDIHSSNCAVNYGGSGWFGKCHTYNIFGPYNGNSSTGIAYQGLETTSSHDNLKYVAMAVRNYNTEGDAIKFVQGKYLNGQQCLNCDNTICATCISSATNCTKNCNSDCLTCLVDGTCQSCEDGKFLKDGQCLPCDNTKCATCQTDAITCIEQCNSDCKTCLPSKQCNSCQDGFWLNGGQCDICDNTQCATCNTSATDCINNCNSDCLTCSVDGTCQSCEDGKFLKDGQCLPCDNTKCATCQTDAITCIEQCNSDCKTCLPSKQCNSCQDGFWLNVGKCDICDNTQCATCNTSATDCIEQCNPECLTCNSDKTCLTCISKKFISELTCLDCDYKCNQCLNTSTQCTECSDITRNINNNCLCKQGYFDTNLQENVCQKCISKCLTCQNNQENCLECNDISRSNPPNCLCSIGYYDDPLLSGECLKCQYNNCDCSEKDKCNSCTGDDKILRELPYCYCKEGYFQNELGNCQKCSVFCKSCISEDQCLVCVQGLGRNMKTPNCGCQINYYYDLSLDNCIQCPPQCDTCNNNGQCLKCLKKNTKLPNCIEQLDVQETQFISFSVDINGIEQQTYEICEKQCKKCSVKKENCEVCNIGLKRQNNPPFCTCENGYHDENGQNLDCQKCSKNCKTCISQYQCLTCNSEDNRTLNYFNQRCECKLMSILVSFQYI